MGACVHLFQTPLCADHAVPVYVAPVFMISTHVFTVVFKGPFLLDVLHPFWLLPPLPKGVLSSLERDLMEAFHVGESVPRLLTICILSGCGSLFLFPSGARGSFSDFGEPELICQIKYPFQCYRHPYFEQFKVISYESV